MSDINILTCYFWTRPIPGAVKRQCEVCGQDVCMDAKNEALVQQMKMSIMCLFCTAVAAANEGGAEITGTAIGGRVHTTPQACAVAWAQREAETSGKN